ncbi:MAG: arginine deiminase-related protein, partial [Pseudomonadota bacterium]
THPALLQDWCARFDYMPVGFTATDAAGQAIYHTNVMMCVGTTFALICEDAVAAADRARVRASLEACGHEVLTISRASMAGFAGNMLELRTAAGEAVIALSSQAFAALAGDVRSALARHGQLVHAPIDHLEQQSGGSVRCMLAEIHLPRA